LLTSAACNSATDNFRNTCSFGGLSAVQGYCRGNIDGGMKFLMAISAFPADIILYCF
jgi:hypothetical protein